MNQFLRILTAALLTLGLVGPLSTVTTFAQTTSGTQAASTTGAVQGTVHDSNGNPIADVSITMKASTALSTRSDAKGTFSFANVTPGIYSVTATKPGYDTATDPAFAVLAGEVDKLDVVMNAITFSSLRTIASVRSVGRGTFNTTTASAQVVTAQQFEDQNATNVKTVLDQIPGIVTDHPGTTANNSAPGAITFPSIRGGLGFETASLIDGHPLAVGLFGDYVTSFLNPFFLQSAEIIKGPGAMAPEVNYAIGGTVNFRTLDPSRTPIAKVQLGVDNFGGQIGNFLSSGTTTNGKFGWVLGYGVDSTPGTLTNNTSAYYDLPRSVSINGGPGIGFVTNPQPSTITGNNGIQNNPNNYATSILASSFPVSQTFVSKSELVKLRYNFSKATSFTASYLGSQTWTDQNGNHVYQYNQVFAPCYTGSQSTVVQPSCAGYTGSLTNGGTYAVWDQVFPPVGEWEVNNEPIFQGELRTTIGQDTLLARAYGASINRLQYNALGDVTDPLSMTLNLWGTDGKGKVYNGGPATVSWPTYAYYCLSSNKSGLNWSSNPYVQNKAGASTGTCYYDATGALMNKTTGFASSSTGAVGPATGSAFFRSMEEDRIHGLSLQWAHPLGNSGNLLTVSYDTNEFGTHAYSYLGDPSRAPSVPDGSRQRQGTLLVRGNFNLGTKWNLVLSNYFNTYYQRYSTDGGSTFQEFNSSHYDPRIGLTFRANQNVSWRFAAGSAIAPPYLGLLNSVNPAFINGPSNGNTSTTVALANGAIKPETSFGYDLGADYRFGGDQSWSATWDAYSTTLWNQFIKTTSLYCAGFNGTTQTCDSATTTPAGDFMVFATQNRNLTNARYQGLELAVRRTPLSGFGGHVQGALVRAYPFNLDPCFYSTTVTKTGTQDCTQFNTNLAVLPNVNFQNSGSSGTPGSYNSVSNHSEPYAQGDLQLDYRWLSGMYAQLGYQLYGHNNSLNEPAFWVARGSLRVPTAKQSSITASVYNIFNTYGNSWITEFGGVPVPLANGKIGLTNANVIGPRTFNLVWRTDIGNQ